MRKENIFSKRKWFFLHPFFRHFFLLLLLLRGGFLRAAALLCLQCREKGDALTHCCCGGVDAVAGWPSGERRDLAPFPRLRRRTFPHPLARRSQERRRVRHLGFKASLWVVLKKRLVLL